MSGRDASWKGLSERHKEEIREEARGEIREEVVEGLKLTGLDGRSLRHRGGDCSIKLVTGLGAYSCLKYRSRGIGYIDDAWLYYLFSR